MAEDTNGRRFRLVGNGQVQTDVNQGWQTEVCHSEPHSRSCGLSDIEPQPEQPETNLTAPNQPASRLLRWTNSISSSSAP